MTDNPKTGINEFILNAAHNEQPVFDAFMELCELQNDPNIDYVDFEWKYYQYYYGNRDLAIERSSENSSPVTFSDIPMDVLEKVVEKIWFRYCLRLRQVSRDLRNLVDSTEIHCERIKFVVSSYYSEIVVGNRTISYRQTLNDGCKVSVDNVMQNIQKYNVDQDALTAMLADASAILRNPKLKIGHLEIGVSDEKEFLEFLEFLKSLNFQLNARSFHFTTSGQSVLSILELLKPKALEKIELEFSEYMMGQIANQLDGIEERMQWKMAKNLYLNRVTEGFPMEKILHFKDIEIDDFELSDKNLIMVRDILLASPQLESCSLKAHVYYGRDWNSDDDDDDEEDDDEEVEVEHNNVMITLMHVDRILSEHPAFDPKTRRIPIPNSQEHFQLKRWVSRISNKLVIKRTTDKRRIEEFIRDSTMSRRPVYSHVCPVFQSYKKLCEQEEHLLMDYVDFEWKYFKYYHGNQDLTLERSPNNSSQVTFSDLPKNVLELVVGKSKVTERLALRNVSRDLRDLVDSTEVHCESMR